MIAVDFVIYVVFYKLNLTTASSEMVFIISVLFALLLGILKNITENYRENTLIYERENLTMKKKILALVLSLCIMGSVVPVSASTVNTSEFGKFTYSLLKSGIYVIATTKTAKVAPKLITKMTIQINSTGQTIMNKTETKTNAKKK